MRIDVRLPQWGMGMSEGTVVQWLKKLGDAVAEGEPIVEVETAKATDFVVAPAAGTLVQLFFEPGDVVPIAELLAVIETDGV